MLKILRKVIVIILSVLLSFGLIFSIPILNLAVKGKLTVKKYTKTEVALVKQIAPEIRPKPQQTARQPRRSTPLTRSPKSGPRFAMDLGVVGGTAGAGISSELLTASGGSNTGVFNGTVDEKPAPQGNPPFQPPAAIRDAELDARLVLAFCVDAGGRPYDIRVVEETPAGYGLAEAGKTALSRVAFRPARKSGNPVPFCGMEQPFEIRFKD